MENNHKDKTAPTLSPENLNDVFLQYKPGIIALASRISRDSDLAQDIAQDVYVKARELITRQPDTIREPAAWLLAIARNHAFSLKRHYARESLDGAPAGSIPDHAPVLEDKLLLFCIDKYVEQEFSPKESKIFSLRYYHHYNLHEIAEIAGTSVAGISRILNRLQKNLKTRFSGVIE
jgi:RNA polymerase sigma factor (sigma-70 family)